MKYKWDEMKLEENVIMTNRVGRIIGDEMSSTEMSSNHAKASYSCKNTTKIKF